MPDFVPLTIRSSYSLLESMLKPKDIVGWLETHGVKAASIADHNNMFGALEFSELLIGSGIKPIMGLSLDISCPEGRTHLLRFYAQNSEGYQNLMALASKVWLESTDGSAQLRLEGIAGLTDNLICLTGGTDGQLYHDLERGQIDRARDWLNTLCEAFSDRLYIEISRHGEATEIRAEADALNLAYDMGLPIVATHDVRFATADNAMAHDALMCIANGSFLGEEERPRVCASQYFQTPDDMQKRFADLPEALESTVEIAIRCSYRSQKRAPILPRFSSSQEGENAALADLARKGLEARLDANPLYAERQAYFTRLDNELSIISKMGFPGYFLIVADFIGWAKANAIPIGPGRGSGAGSLVAWSLQITDLDPLQFDLLFERFLNPERVSMPDFDIDFCQERRGEVIRYVRDKYGEASTASIITFGSLQAKAVVRDVGRVMQMPYGQVDRLAKLIPFNPAKPPKLAEAIDNEPKFDEEVEKDPRVKELLDIALELEGLYRNAGTHAAGVVIGDRPLTELVPLYRDPRADLPATQFNMYWVEQAGLVKFDFLGLKTLTVIDRALAMAAENGAKPNAHWQSLDCKDTYAMLAAGESFGVFQLEGQGMRDTLKRARPNNIEDIIAIISLYRPGPMDNIPTYIEGKEDPSTIRYDHPDLAPILAPTYGVPVYQEQVMRMAQEIAGYSLGEADLLRRAMGKKKQAEMDKQRDRFVSGAAKLKDIGTELANKIFDTMAKFAGYGFNKSHAAAYAVLGYQTGFLKCHFPAEFLAASMSLDIQNTDKLGAFFLEARYLSVPVCAPCINESEADFSVRKGKIHYALGAIKGVGFDAMKTIVAERQSSGKFKDIDDFCARIDPRLVNKKALEQLIRAGALDSLHPNRAALLAAVPIINGAAQQAAQDRQAGQSGLFGDIGQSDVRLDIPQCPPWGNQTTLAKELDAIGFYCSGHPLDDVLKSLDRSRFYLTNEINERALDGKPLEMIGMVTAISERPARQDGKLGFVTISDPAGEVEIIAYPETWLQMREQIRTGNSIYAKLGVRRQGDEIRLNLLSADTLENTNLGTSLQAIEIELSTDADADSLQTVSDLLTTRKCDHGGQVFVRTKLRDGRTFILALPQVYETSLSTQQQLRAANGVNSVIEIDAERTRYLLRQKHKAHLQHAS